LKQLTIIIEGIFRGVKFSGTLKIRVIYGEKIHGLRQKEVKLAVILTFISKYVVVLFLTTTTTNLLPVIN
jgi:hypothetical protein